MPACASTISCCHPRSAGRLKKGGVDRDERGRDGASDHAPAWIELR